MGADSSWPAWATEPVHLVDSDGDWPARGQGERRELEGLLWPWLTRRIEHVGSTAVPGLPAKPIIDLQAAVADLACTAQVAARLTGHGWQLVDPDLDRRPWRGFLVKVTAGRRSAHLHLMTADSPRWGEQLAFRDALRADRALRQAYAGLKRELAARHAEDREAYSDAKGDFLRAVLAGLG